MADLNTITNAVLPKVTIYGSILVTTISWIILILVFLGISGLILYIWWMRKLYKHKIIIFESDGKNISDSTKDTAKEIKIGDLGLNIFYCRKHKKYIPRPSLQSGKNKWYFRKLSNDMWENFQIKDDETPDMLSLRVVDKNLLERNVGIRKGIETRYKNSNWLKENAVMLLSAGVIIFLVVFGWLYADKLISMTKEVAGVTNAQREITTQQADIMATLSKMLDSAKGGYVKPNG